MTVLVAAGALAMLASALAAADLGALLVARARAHAAAEAAALAAAVEQAPILSHGLDPDDAARDMAARNGAVMLRCECARGEADAIVEVAVAPRMLAPGRWAGRRAHATAHAELDPDVLSYRPPE